jgi:hypothetical protein
MRKDKQSLQNTFGLSWVPRVPEYASRDFCESFGWSLKKSRTQERLGGGARLAHMVRQAAAEARIYLILL